MGVLVCFKAYSLLFVFSFLWGSLMVVAWATVVSATVSTVAAGSGLAFGLYITFGFGQQRLVRQFVFASLFIDGNQFHFDFVTH